MGIRPGEDPGGAVGSRKAQFRRYVAGVDQHDPQQLGQLGAALGSLIDEVATSKQGFLIKAAEGDGFFFADGSFTPAKSSQGSFAVTRVEDLASIEDRGRRLRLLANDNPKDAIGGASELLESLCRTILRLGGEPAPAKTAALADIAKSTLKALKLAPAGNDGAKKSAPLVGKSLQHLGDIVAGLGEQRSAPSPREARLAVGAAVTFASFVAEAYVERADAKTGP